VTANIVELISQLGSREARERELAAAYLGDVVEASSLSDGDHETVAAALVRAAVDEDNVSARESQLHAVTYFFELSFRTVQPLIALMPTLDAEQIDYCLGILAATRDPAAEAAIRSFIEHSDERIRVSANDALTELRGRFLD
jgi:hypothetical protein